MVEFGGNASRSLPRLALTCRPHRRSPLHRAAGSNFRRELALGASHRAQELADDIAARIPLGRPRRLRDPSPWRTSACASRDSDKVGWSEPTLAVAEATARATRVHLRSTAHGAT